MLCVFITKPKNLFYNWRPYPIFVALVSVYCLCLYALVPVSSHDLWQSPQLVKCTSLINATILALSFGDNSLYVSLKYSNEYRTHILEYMEYETVPAININEPAHSNFSYGNSTIQITEYTVALANTDDYIFATDDDPAKIGIYVVEKNAPVPLSYRFATLKDLPTSMTVSAGYVYTSGQHYNNFIVQIKRPLNHSVNEVAANQERRIYSFGDGDLNTFTDPRGLLFFNNVLYVCDENRVLAFMESTNGELVLIKIFAPIREPISLAIYKNNLAVTTNYYILFYNLHTAAYLGSITQLGSFLISASQNYLYVADHTKICAYKQEYE